MQDTPIEAYYFTMLTTPRHRLDSTRESKKDVLRLQSNGLPKMPARNDARPDFFVFGLILKKNGRRTQWCLKLDDEREENANFFRFDIFFIKTSIYLRFTLIFSFSSRYHCNLCSILFQMRYFMAFCVFASFRAGLLKNTSLKRHRQNLRSDPTFHRLLVRHKLRYKWHIKSFKSDKSQ